MSLTRQEYEEILFNLKKIEYLAKKVYRARHFKWANDINWYTQRIKDKIQQVIGQME